MKSRVIIIVLVLGIAIVSVSLISALGRVNMVGNNAGYRPEATDRVLAPGPRRRAGDSVPVLPPRSRAQSSRGDPVPEHVHELPPLRDGPAGRDP